MELDDWIACIRNRDPTTFEDAYYGERPTGPDIVPRLVAELHRAPDGYTRGKFAELLGEMGDASVVPVLIAELSHPEEDARQWAVLALENLGVPEGMDAAKRHRELEGSDFSSPIP